MKHNLYTDDDIFDMYANQADRDYLRNVPLDTLSRQLMEVDHDLSINRALVYANAIKRVVNKDNEP